jgi:hypothetical protein
MYLKSGDHPSGSLAKFGYKTDMKVKKKFKHPSHFFGFFWCDVSEVAIMHKAV